jgi:molybdopterin/thiamine biosynthesis adenylyltransferase
MKFKKAAIIGAGGIGCVLVPIISRMMDVVIVDGDSYEPENVSRQFPALHSTENKAEALARMSSPNTLMKIQAIPDYFRDDRIILRDEWQGVDLVISAVDNNASRRIIAEFCEDRELPLIMAGNEHTVGEAHLLVPGLYNPMDHFDFPETEPAPWACNHDATLDEHPQTPIANALAAGATLHILLSINQAQDLRNAVCMRVLARP